MAMVEGPVCSLLAYSRCLGIDPDKASLLILSCKKVMKFVEKTQIGDCS
jgi:hypothetical protein